MKKIYLSIIWCLLLGTLVSCEQETASSDPDPAPVKVEDYQPTSAGSTWSYTGAISYNVTATGNNQVINGKTFQEFETKQGTTVTKSYINKDNGVYTGIGMVKNMGNVAIAILNEGVAVGKSWEQTAKVDGVDVKMILTMEEKGLTKTVAGRTFKDVIHVQMISSYSFMGEDLGLELTADYYFAKGVGLVFADLGTYGTVVLDSYTIK